MARPAGYIARAERYAKAVVSGKIPACEWVRKAASRHLTELEKSKKKAWPYRFDAAKAERVCRFIELMPHTKGKWAREGQRLLLADWQIFKTCVLMGWVHKKSGMRRFRRAFILEPRKNGKSAWAAALALYFMVADNEFGAEVYPGATTEKQAWEVFRPARLMALRSPDLLAHFHIEVNASNIHTLSDGSRMEPIIGKPGDGSSPSLAITDEYHEHADDSQVEAMVTGMGAREQPLHLVITTAGDNIAGPCYEAQLEAQKVLSGALENDELFALIYTVDKGDDWTTLAALRKANPNFDISVSAEFLIARQKEAIANARKQGAFKTKHLNMWVGARAAAFNVEAWIECGRPQLSLADFRGMRCLIGLDLSSKTDLAAVEILIPLGEYIPGVEMAKRFARFGIYYLPSATIDQEQNEHYQGWRDAGLLREADGPLIDYDEIFEDIMDVGRVHGLEIEGIGADPSRATHLMTRLMAENLPVMEVPQTAQNLSEPMKQMDAMMLAGAYDHDGDPIMLWAVSNVTNKPDRRDRWYPNKERVENKIDPVVAHLNALAIHMGDDVPPMSRYETEGLADLPV
jgi:phage terminase large subunit-like protein